ncbi:hypothetical protein E3N88_07986 [Mikania micrantha]|uniref:Extensin domain-containing protein n=1 Tax=Mikania micrantha TaxID=192012 RepID=A0A5N6PGY1_9ASTR|nr:hypothetical protein E3N88_07986 [Mikania micrantha]
MTPIHFLVLVLSLVISSFNLSLANLLPLQRLHLRHTPPVHESIPTRHTHMALLAENQPPKLVFMPRLVEDDMPSSSSDNNQPPFEELPPLVDPIDDPPIDEQPPQTSIDMPPPVDQEPHMIDPIDDPPFEYEPPQNRINMLPPSDEQPSQTLIYMSPSSDDQSSQTPINMPPSTRNQPPKTPSTIKKHPLMTRPMPRTWRPFAPRSYFRHHPSRKWHPPTRLPQMAIDWSDEPGH